MEREPRAIFEELRKDVSAYLDTRLLILRLELYEKTSRTIATLSFGLILLFLALFAFFFIFLALGFLLGECLGSVAGGFAIIAAFYLVATGLFFLFGKRIRTWLINKVLVALSTTDSKEQAQNGTE